MKKVFKIIGIGFLCLLGLGIIMCIFEDKDVARAQEKERNYVKFQKDSLEYATNSPWIAENRVEKQIVSMLKDPDSFKIHNKSTVYNKYKNAYIVDIDYGAKNSFGGMVRSRQLYEIKVTCQFDTIKNDTETYTEIVKITNLM